MLNFLKRREPVTMLDEMRMLADQMAAADSIYSPTSFWLPGVEKLMKDLEGKPFDTFKTWASSRAFFYQEYGQRYDMRLVDELWGVVEKRNGLATKPWLNQQLLGSAQAHHDMDIAIARWNQKNWPFDFKAFGESDFGGRQKTYAVLGADGPRFGRAYLSYLKALAELSNYIDAPPRSVLEIGGGYACLAEILLPRDPSATYTDIDIPPTLLIAAEYISAVFGPGAVAKAWQGKKKATFVPSWQTPTVQGPFDLFVNCYSFQEMEPNVVSNYIDQVCRMRPKYVVSLNSAKGKPKASEVGKGHSGVIEPVVSSFIQSQFEAGGYDVVATAGRPIAPPQAQLIIMKRK